MKYQFYVLYLLILGKLNIIKIKKVCSISPISLRTRTMLFTKIILLSRAQSTDIAYSKCHIQCDADLLSPQPELRTERFQATEIVNLEHFELFLR